MHVIYSGKVNLTINCRLSVDVACARISTARLEVDGVEVDVLKEGVEI